MKRGSWDWLRTALAALALIGAGFGGVLFLQSGQSLESVRERAAGLWGLRSRPPAPAEVPVGLGALSASGDRYGATSWYFPYGRAVNSGDRHDTWLILANPGTTATRAEITYHLGDGFTTQQSVDVPSQGRVPVFTNQTVQGEFSVSVRSAAALVAEQSTFFTNEGFTIHGVSTPSTVWYLPEGPVGGTYLTCYHVFNPGGSAADLTFTFYSEKGETQVATRSVPAGKALRVPLSELSNLTGSLAARIAADVPVVVERVTTFAGRDGGRGGHATLGTSLLTRTSYFPLLIADANFDSWLMLLNPGDSPVNVNVTYWREAVSKSATYTVAPHSRFTVWVDDEARQGRAPEGTLSLVLQSDAPIAAEAIVYDAAYQAGASTMGTPGLARRWYFAEGSTSTPYTTFYALFNPGPAGAMVSASLLPPATTTAPLRWALRPGELKFVNLNELAPNMGPGAYFAADGAIVVERMVAMTGSGLMSGLGLPDAMADTKPVAFLPIVISPPKATPTPAPTATPLPGVTPQPSAEPTRVQRGTASAMIIANPIVGTANCGTTGIKGRLTDSAGAPIPGVQVRVWSQDWNGGSSNPSDADGRWDFVLGTGARAGTWFAAPMDANGQFIALPVAIVTSADCQNGHQWAEVNWQGRVAAAPRFALAWTRRLACDENHGNHSLFIDVTDMNGAGIAGVTLRVTWDGGAATVATGNKLDVGPGRAEFPMYKGTYNITVIDGPSDVGRNLTVELPDEPCPNGGNTLFHYSYHVVYRLTQ